MVSVRFIAVLIATFILIGGATAAMSLSATSARSVAPRAADTTGVSEAQTIALTVGDKLWPGWSKTAFIIDLLTPEYEILLNTSTVPKGFVKPASGNAYRRRTFPPNLEATFPAFDAKPVVVIGEQPLTAAKTPTRWTVTLLHEHFHQWQTSWPAYNSDVGALGLTHGDKTGMWMLDYAFPYGSPRTDTRFEDLATHLSAAVQTAGTRRFDSALQSYLQVRAAWRASLKHDDYTYFSFQCWQEGVARYTEYRVAQLAAQAHDTHSSFASLTAPQAQLLDKDAQHTYAGILKQLNAASLQKDKRVAFYAVGAGEALLLDRIAIDWRKRYLNAHMDLSIFFPAAASRPEPQTSP